MSGGPYSRAHPFPWDLELDPGDGNGYVGLMLKPGQDGLLVGRKEQFLPNVAPQTHEYSSAPPDRESTFVFGRLTGGMGEKTQSSGASKRYRYALDVDCSIGGMPRLGPAFTAATFPGIRSPGFVGDPLEVRQFIVALDGPTRTLFVLVDQYVYKRVAGAWVLSKNFGAGEEPMQAVVFTGTAGTGGLWVATIGGALWNYDGTTWTQADLAAVSGGPAFAERVETVGNELYIGSGWEVRVCTGNPLLAGSWGGSIQAGSRSTRISCLRAVGNTLFIFKWDGIYTLNADGSDNDLFPEMRTQQLAFNGLTAVPWRNALWFGYGDAFYRMDSTASLEPIGPERLVDLDAAMRGRAISAAGHADWFLYLGTYAADTNTSYLLKYGTYTSTGTSSGVEFADAWHGAIAHWAGKRITRVAVVQFDTDLDPSLDGPTLWVGFDDGTTAWTPLPLNTPDPAADARCRFTASGSLYWPIHDEVYAADVKAWHALTSNGSVLNASQFVRQRYRTDPTAGYTTLTPDFTASGQRVELPDLVTGAARDASTGIRIECVTDLITASSALTPVLEGMALHAAVRPRFRVEYSCTVRAANRLVRRDGIVSRRDATRIRALIRTAAASPGHIRLRLPDEEVGAFAQVAYTESLAPAERRWGLAWDIAVSLIQFR